MKLLIEKISSQKVLRFREIVKSLREETIMRAFIKGTFFLNADGVCIFYKKAQYENMFLINELFYNKIFEREKILIEKEERLNFIKEKMWEEKRIKINDISLFKNLTYNS